jgi:hypothetical protein
MRHRMRQSMRCLYVGANVSPMDYDVSAATMPIKPVLLSYKMKSMAPPPLCLAESAEQSAGEVNRHRHAS